MPKLTPKRQKFYNYLEIFDDHKLFTMTYDDKIVVNMPSSLEKQLDILISDHFQLISFEYQVSSNQIMHI